MDKEVDVVDLKDWDCMFVWRRELLFWEKEFLAQLVTEIGWENT
jgi:hypothetical protein